MLIGAPPQKGAAVLLPCTSASLMPGGACGNPNSPGFNSCSRNNSSFKATAEARKLEYDRPLIPKRKIRRNTSINHPTSISYFFGVYCRALIRGVVARGATVDQWLFGFPGGDGYIPSTPNDLLFRILDPLRALQGLLFGTWETRVLALDSSKPTWSLKRGALWGLLFQVVIRHMPGCSHGLRMY